MRFEEFIRQTCVVSVFYRKKWQESEIINSLESICLQFGYVPDLLLFDNSPQINNEKPKSDCLNIQYFENNQNCGVSSSFNKAASIARENGKKWLLITDCDFKIEPGLFKAYYDSLIKYSHCKLFSPILRCNGIMVSPYKKKFHRYSIIKALNPGEYASGKYFIINNGIFCSPDIFLETGGYNPKIGLDFSDDYFMAKYTSKYSTFVVVDYEGKHNLSSFEKHDFQGALRRFKWYCEGAHQMSFQYKDGYWFFIWAFLRMLRLITMYARFDFAKVFLSTFLVSNRSHKES